MTNSPTATLSSSTTNCETCSLSDLCLSVGLSSSDLSKLDSLITEQPLFHKGEILYSQGSKFTSLYAVRAGAFKSSHTQYGVNRITAFNFPGELIGFEGISEGKYKLTCTALETSTVCIIPFERLLELSLKLPSISENIIKILSGNLAPDTYYSIMDTAEVRVAKFILHLSSGLKRIGRSPNRIQLPMTKHEIADFLGLAYETLIRILKKFEERQLIASNKPAIDLIDIYGLQKLLLL